MYYYNARYYDPEDGRFISQDTYRGEQMEPGTWHLYAYCANNPVNYVDPSGHKKVRIYLGVHTAFGMTPFRHASVLVFVQKGNKYYNDRRFKKYSTKKNVYGGTSRKPAHYVTFGGQSSEGVWGKLIGKLNRPSDVKMSNKIVMKRLLATNSNNKVNTLFKRFYKYAACPTKPKYDLFPGKKKRRGNSNSFANRLLRASGFYVTQPAKRLPGWGHPASKAYFGL